MLDWEGRPIDMVDELSMVGYTEDTTVEQVFEKNGTCTVGKKVSVVSLKFRFDVRGPEPPKP